MSQPSQPPVAKGKKAEKKKEAAEADEKWAVAAYTDRVENLSADLIHIDRDLTKGQVRRINETTVKELETAYAGNGPDELLLTVSQDRGMLSSALASCSVYVFLLQQPVCPFFALSFCFHLWFKAWFLNCFSREACIGKAPWSNARGTEIMHMRMGFHIPLVSSQEPGNSTSLMANASSPRARTSARGC